MSDAFLASAYFLVLAYLWPKVMEIEGDAYV